MTEPFEPRAHCANTLRLGADPTEQDRRALIPQMPHLAQQELDAGRPVWDTDAMRAEFTVTGFLAPFVTVTRKADGQKGTLMFTSAPRFYFAWVPE
jgi:hypothetical protein